MNSKKVRSHFMNGKKYLRLFLILILVNPASTLFAADDLCYQNSFGDFFRLSGGKIGSKPFVAEWLSAACGSVPGLATSIRDEQNNTLLAIHVSYTDTCSAVVWSFVGDHSLNSATGTYNNFPRTSPPHSGDSITKVDCSTLPSVATLKQTESIGIRPGKRN